VSGGGAFGFEVPQGDPGAVDGAASSWRTLGETLGIQGEAVAAGSELALGAGSWDGPAASAFGGSSERLVDAFTTNVAACGQAASALSELARALEQAQQVTRQALADCEHAQTEATTQQAAADEAGRTAQSAHQAAATAVHPSVAMALGREAVEAEGQQSIAQGAANQANGELATARARGIHAVSTYEHEAAVVSARLRAAGAELRKVPELGHGWAEPVVTWAGHVNDYAGAGAVGLVKGYDMALARAADRLEGEIQDTFANPAAVAGIKAGLPAEDIFGPELDPEFDHLVSSQALAESPLTKVLTASLPEDSFPLLSKVPYLAAALTVTDMIMNRGDGVGPAVIEPVGNLVTGTVITEVSAPAVAAGITSLTADGGMLAALGTTAIVPGVGEFVIVGALAVGGTYAIDKGVSWVWDHGGEHVASVAWHGIEKGADWAYHEGGDLVHDAGTVVHDIEPWNWSL
jgi:hypothetical protein